VPAPQVGAEVSVGSGHDPVLDDNSQSQPDEVLASKPEAPLSSADADTDWLEVGKSATAQDRHQDAVQAFTRAAQKNPKNWKTWELLGKANSRIRDLDSARKAFQTGIKLAPAEPRLWHGLGRVEIMDRKPEMALKYLEKARRLAPDTYEGLPFVHMQIGLAHLRLKNYDQARENFALAKSIAHTADAVAAIEKNEGKLDKAIEKQQRAKH
jgi:tetratricopeptide (TPR) repeat protein